MNLQNLWNPWRTNDFSPLGLTATDFLISTAEMLAAHRLLSEDPESLARRETELTANEWAKARDRAEQIWRERGGRDEPQSMGASPFAQALGAIRWPPGYFEHLRLAVLEAAQAHLGSDEQNGSLATVLSLLEVSQGRRGPGWLPAEVSKLAAGLVGSPAPKGAYCAFEGAAVPALVLGCNGTKVVLEIPHAQAAAFWSALAVGALAEVIVRVASPFDHLTQDEIFQRQDVAIVVPPFGAKVSGAIPPKHMPLPSSSEAWGLALARLMARGKAACVVLDGFLFRSSMADQAFKERIIIQYGLETVVSLPQGIAASGSNLAASILVLGPRTSHDDGVLMVDASDAKRGRGAFTEEDRCKALELVQGRKGGGPSRRVSLEEIGANDFNIQPERYVLSARAQQLADLLLSEDTVSLGDLVEVYRPQPSPPVRIDQHGFASTEPDAARELVVSDLSDLGLASPPSKQLSVSQGELHRLRKAELQAGDIVLVTKGSVGRVGLIQQIPEGETWVANQSFAILRLRRAGPIRTPTVLFRYLNSWVGQELLQSLKVGRVLPTLQMADLKRLRVIVPSKDTQDQVIRQMDSLFETQARIDELRRKQHDLQAQIWPETLS
jgi:type I restriction enzyme M protein